MFHSMKSTLLFVLLVASAAAQQPTFETRKITDNVYVFRYVGHQSMFVVTPEGVIATDPIAYLRPQAAKAHIDEIRKFSARLVRFAGSRPRARLGAHDSGASLCRRTPGHQGGRAQFDSVHQ